MAPPVDPSSTPVFGEDKFETPTLAQNPYMDMDALRGGVAPKPQAPVRAADP